MATSPNFSWPEPDNTDLVKNGALAIRTAINAIDTSMVDLKGGTTGQVLSKASATDMDFSWVTDATGIPATIFDAKGDIIAATAADTAGRLAVGTNGQTLVADSSTATGLKWSAPATGALTLIKTASFTAAADTGTTFDGVFTSTYSTYMVAINWTQSAVVECYYRVRSGTTTYSSNYESDRMLYSTSATYSQGAGEVLLGVGHSSIKSFANMQISPALAASQRTLGNWQGFAIGSGGALVGSFQQYSAVNHDGFILTAASGTITGTASVYGMAK